CPVITRTIRVIVASIAIVTAVVVGTDSATAATAYRTSTYAPRRAKQRTRHPYRRQFVKETFGKKALLGLGASAGLAQARNSPHEWGRGGAGLAKRTSSAFGQHATKKSIQYTVSSLRHEEVGYQPSSKRGFGPRLEHALASTVVTHKTTTGRRTIAGGRISGAVGSGFVSRAWQPARLHTVSSGLATGGMSLGADAGKNVITEFW